MKLSLFAIISIGLVATALSAAAMALLFIRPDKLNIEYHQAYIDQLDQKIAKKAEAEQLVRDVEQERQRVINALRRYEVTHMPPPSVAVDYSKGRMEAWEQYHDLVRFIGKKLENWPIKTGVNLRSGFQLPAPPTDPNQLPTMTFTFPTQQVTVRASSFERLLNHYRAWNRVPNVLVLVDGLTIQGTSPDLVGTYSLQVFVFPKGQPPAAVGGAAPGAMPGGGMPGPANIPRGGMGAGMEMPGGK